MYQKQILRAGRINYIPQYPWDVIKRRYLWYILLVQSSHVNLVMRFVRFGILCGGTSVGDISCGCIGTHLTEEVFVTFGINPG